MCVCNSSSPDFFFLSSVVCSLAFFFIMYFAHDFYIAKREKEKFMPVASNFITNVPVVCAFRRVVSIGIRR